MKNFIKNLIYVVILSVFCLLVGVIAFWKIQSDENQTLRKYQIVEQRKESLAKKIALKKFGGGGFDHISEVDAHIGDYFTVILVNRNHNLKVYSVKGEHGDINKISIEAESCSNVEIIPNGNLTDPYESVSFSPSIINEGFREDNSIKVYPTKNIGVHISTGEAIEEK